MRAACWSLILCGAAGAHAFAQSSLQEQIRALAGNVPAKVSVACALPNQALDCNLLAASRPPMQSVFKLPLALVILQQVDAGKLTLDQPVRFLKSDRILPHTYSPLQDKYPEADVYVPLRELLRLTVSLSDNSASDVLLRLAGGPAIIEASMHKLGVAGFQLRDGEDGLAKDVQAQYGNWFEPRDAVKLLLILKDGKALSAESTAMLLSLLAQTQTGPNRIRAGLPAGTVLMHKTGTSGMEDGLLRASNDIGLIALPDGRDLALAIFVTDANVEQSVADGVIARITGAIYQAALKAR